MISNSTEGVYMGTEHKAGFENSRMKGSLTIVGLGAWDRERPVICLWKR